MPPPESVAAPQIGAR